AVRHVALAVGVVRAAAQRAVEQLAVNPRRNDLARLLVLEPHQAAQAATVAQALPLGLVHLREGFAVPEWTVGAHALVLYRSSSVPKARAFVRSSFQPRTSARARPPAGPAAGAAAPSAAQGRGPLVEAAAARPRHPRRGRRRRRALGADDLPLGRAAHPAGRAAVGGQP